MSNIVSCIDCKMNESCEGFDFCPLLKKTNNKKYAIKIKYETGNSSERHEEEDTLECSWNDLNIAKENLKRIKEHHLWYENIDKYHRRKGPKIEKPSFVVYDCCLKLLTDDRNEFQLSAFWLGYFETLYRVKIVENEDSDMVYITEQGKFRCD